MRPFPVGYIPKWSTEEEVRKFVRQDIYLFPEEWKRPTAMVPIVAVSLVDVLSQAERLDLLNRGVNMETIDFWVSDEANKILKFAV